MSFYVPWHLIEGESTIRARHLPPAQYKTQFPRLGKQKLPDLNQSASHLPAQARFAASAVESARYGSSLNAITERARGRRLYLLQLLDAAFPMLVSLTPSQNTSQRYFEIFGS